MRSLALQSIPLAALIILSSGGASSFAQIQTTQPVTPVAMSNATQDPTRPEVQPRLDIDRDPIPSPDLDVAASVSNNSPSNTTAPGSTPPLPVNQASFRNCPTECTPSMRMWMKSCSVAR